VAQPGRHPTRLTVQLYPQLMGTTNTTARERLDFTHTMLAAKTGFWRGAPTVKRGSFTLFYLTCSYPGVYTADHFEDVTETKAGPSVPGLHGRGVQAAGVYITSFNHTAGGGGGSSFYR